MSFTYNMPPTQPTDYIRLLIGDVNSAAPNFQDAELTAMMGIFSQLLLGPDNTVYGEAPQFNQEVLYMTCAACMDSLAAKIAGSKDGRSYKLGDYQLTGKDQIQKVQDMAQRFRDLVNDTPAWGIVETNESDLNALIIIRNYVLRTTP